MLVAPMSYGGVAVNGDGGVFVNGVKASAGVTLKETTDTTTIYASDSGKTYICTKQTKFQLPSPSKGLTYTFVTGASVKVQIQVDTTPTTIVLFEGTDGGVIETATKTTGNTITLVSDGTNWYKLNSSGTWQDGGSWIILGEGVQ